MLAGVAGADEVSGIVEPRHDVLLAAPVPGIIAAIPHREGARVAAGEVLVELDARLEDLEVARRKLVLEDEAEITAARARAALLEKDLEATRRLFETTRSVSREELDRKELEHRLASLEVIRLEQAKHRERIEHQMAEEQRARRRIVAPFDGVVVELLHDLGETVQPHQPVIRMVDDATAYLAVHLEAAEAASVREGDPARLRLGVAGPIDRMGEVDLVSPVVDPASGLRRIRIRFENRDPRIEPGTVGTWHPDRGEDGHALR